MNSEKSDKIRIADDELFAGRGSPAFMSSKEPAIRLLKERYSESFAVTFDREKGQGHLFLVKLGLWSLVFTFTKRDFVASSQKFEISEVLQIIEDALTGKNELIQKKLDDSVKKSLERIKDKVSQFGTFSQSS
jgi:hypothetical protein